MNGIKVTKEQLLASARLFKSKTEWRKYRNLDYRRAVQQGHLPSIYAELGWTANSFTRWSHEKCLEIARSYKYLQDWREGNWNSFIAAREHGWLELIREEIKFKPKWSSKREEKFNV